jgi:hypothetical protein
VSPHLWFSRVFNEAARDLDSQPPPRTDHVEACRPRGCTHHPSRFLPALPPNENNADPSCAEDPSSVGRRGPSVSGDGAFHLGGLALSQLGVRV